MNKTLSTLALAMGLAISAGAAADNNEGRDLSEIRAQQIEMREDALAGDGIFEGMNKTDRAALAERQSRLLAMIEGKQTVQDLDDKEQVAAFNLLQEISTAITEAEGEQVVCESVQRTGSHRREKRCTTIAERRREREEARRALDKALNGFGPPRT